MAGGASLLATGLAGAGTAHALAAGAGEASQPVPGPAAALRVLGHQNCGAVKAAIEFIESGRQAPGHIKAVVDALRPAYRVAQPQPGDLVDNMVRAQIRLTVRQLKRDPLLSDQLIVGGRYEMASGVIDVIA